MTTEPLGGQPSGGSSPVNGQASRADDAARLACLGYRVFPLRADKRPIIEDGFHGATTDAAQVARWWGAYPSALVGVAVPDGCVVVDVDSYKPEYRVDHGLDMPATAGQQTRRGGQQFFYRTDGRQARQSAGKAAPAIDTRVGGKGYVVAWEPTALLKAMPESWALAPEWVYARPARTSASGGGEVLGTRTTILSWLGSIASHATVTASEYRAMLGAARDDGRIVALDAGRPWTDADLDKLAAEAARWETPREGEFAQDEPVAESAAEYLRLPPDVLEPAPPRPLSPILCDSRTMWFGQQGAGKGLMVVMSVAALADADEAFVPGTSVAAPLRVGLLDWEDNQDEWAERLHRAGVPGRSVPYLAPSGPLTNKAVLANVGLWIDGEGVDLIVVDSVIPAAGGADAMKPEAPTVYYQALRVLGRPSLSLAHVPKDKAQATHPFGSTYWSTPSRLIWRVEKASSDGEQHVVRMTNTKHSRWPWHPELLLRVGWADPDPLRLHEALNLTMEPGAAPLIDRIVLALRLAGVPLTAEELVTRVKSDARTVRRTIERHARRVASDGERPARYSPREPSR